MPGIAGGGRKYTKITKTKIKQMFTKIKKHRSEIIYKNNNKIETNNIYLQKQNSGIFAQNTQNAIFSFEICIFKIRNCLKLQKKYVVKYWVSIQHPILDKNRF